MSWFNNKSKPKGKSQTKHEKRILDLESELESKDRIIAILQAEIDTMALVLARDRSRVECETAIINRKRANAESNSNELQQFEQSIRQFSA